MYYVFDSSVDCFFFFFFFVLTFFRHVPKPIQGENMHHSMGKGVFGEIHYNAIAGIQNKNCGN